VADPQDDPLDQPEEESAAELVMPFVTVASEGGPHDDTSYVAGWECGAVDARLQLCAAVSAEPLPTVVQTVNLPQLDLVAMRHGYVMTPRPDLEIPEWSHVTFAFSDGAPRT
jgi:hypothetical protein